jgi:hypothetical protein
MPGLFNFDSGFGSSGGSDIEREYLDYLREKDAQVAAARRRAGDEAFAYQSKADDRDYGLKKETLKLKRQELLEIGIPQAKVDKWYKEAQIQLARETLIEDRRQFDAKFGEDQRQFNATFGEDQRQFNASTGLDVLKTGASLSGPENYFEAADFARGVQQRGDVPKFLEDLRSTGAPELATGPYSQQPTPLTLGSLTARLTGQPSTASSTSAGGNATDEAARALAAVTEIGMRPNKIAPMGIETLQPGEQKALASGLGKAGFYTPDWLQQYRQGGLGFGEWAA